MKSPYNQLSRPGLESEHDTMKVTNLETYERCAFCHSKLVFSHDHNIPEMQVVETGNCPSCGASMHPKKFSVH